MPNTTSTLNKGDQYIGTVITSLAISLFFAYLCFFFIPLDSEIKFLIVLACCLLIPLILCFFTLIKFRKNNRLQEIDYLNIGIQRYILGIMMVYYGMPKLMGNFFDYQLFALDSKMWDVSEFELAWYFYGKNRWQELLAGIMEFIPGLFLLRRRTYYIAALILLPVTSQVFLLNFFFKIGGITFQAATILLACNIYIIYSKKEDIIRFYKSLNFSSNHTFIRKPIKYLFKGIGILFILLAIFMNLKTVFKSETDKRYEKLVGVYTIEEMKKNNIDYSPDTTDSLYYKDLYIEKQTRWNILRRFNNKTDAFVININPQNDSLKIFINKSGIGDGMDILDSLSVLNGTYKINDAQLIINGIQFNDTLMLIYRKQDIKPKKWFW